MTAPHIIDPGRLLGQALSDASPDLMRHLLSTVINALLSADADAVCGAEYGVSSPERVNQRNGYRHRDLDTRAGTIDVAIPKLREGSYFPEWLLERRKRAEAALVSVVATCYLRRLFTPAELCLHDGAGPVNPPVHRARALSGSWQSTASAGRSNARGRCGRQPSIRARQHSMSSSPMTWMR